MLHYRFFRSPILQSDCLKIYFHTARMGRSISNSKLRIPLNLVSLLYDVVNTEGCCPRTVKCLSLSFMMCRDQWQYVWLVPRDARGSQSQVTWSVHTPLILMGCNSADSCHINNHNNKNDWKSAVFNVSPEPVTKSQLALSGKVNNG